MKTNKKKVGEKTPIFKKKTKIGYSVLNLRKFNFKTKIIHFEKFHNALGGTHEIFGKQKMRILNNLLVPKNLKGSVWDFLTFVVAKYQ